jgi:hypothetical protein
MSGLGSERGSQSHFVALSDAEDAVIGSTAPALTASAPTQLATEERTADHSASAAGELPRGRMRRSTCSPVIESPRFEPDASQAASQPLELRERKQPLEGVK